MSTSTPSTCSICLATAQARGGVPLFSPGCCGTWYHQSCIDGLIAQGSKTCPMCRAALPLPISPPIQQFQNVFQFPNVQNVQQQQTAMPNGYFNCMNNNRTSLFASSTIPDEDMVNPAASASVSSTALPTVSVSTSPEYREVPLVENSAFHVRVNVHYEEVEALSACKVPLDVVCVLDNSGSMTGSKLDSLKKAMDFVINTLGSNDRLSVVNFNSHPTVLHGLLKMSPDNQAIAKAHIRSLRATGGTNILKGMQQGWAALEGRRSKNPASCMFLLTDGQDRDNLQSKLDLARVIKSSGTSLFVFGFGADHDSEHMDAIANAAESVFTYVEADSMVTDAFGGTIGTQQGVSLSNIQLSIEACEHSVTVSQVLAGRYSSTLQGDGRGATVSFVNMFLGESRDILLKLHMPAVASPVDDYELLRASATFQVQGESTSAHPHTAQQSSTCLVQRKKDENFTAAGRARDMEVDVQINRLECAAAVEQALREADRNNFESARTILATTRANLLVSPSYNAQHNTSIGLMQETEDALQRVQNRAEYQSGGRAMMQEAVSSNTYQRSCYSKGGRAKKFQTNSSACMQETACKSKAHP